MKPALRGVPENWFCLRRRIREDTTQYPAVNEAFGGLAVAVAGRGWRTKTGFDANFANFRKLLGRGTAQFWSAATCRRFKTGRHVAQFQSADMSRRSPRRPAQSRRARQFRSRHGLRRQSVAATALSPVRASPELSRTIARTKPAWNSAFSASAVHLSRSGRRTATL